MYTGSIQFLTAFQLFSVSVVFRRPLYYSSIRKPSIAPPTTYLFIAVFGELLNSMKGYSQFANFHTLAKSVY